MNLTIFWLVTLFVLVIIEIITMGLTTVWFAGGALVAALAAAVGLPVYIQVPLFLIVSILLLIFTRPVALKYFNRDRARTNVEGLVGQQAIVTASINNLKAEGNAVVNGQEWTARSINNGLLIEQGTVVEICGINGVKLIVRPWQVPNMVNQNQIPNAVQPPIQNQINPNETSNL